MYFVTTVNKDDTRCVGYFNTRAEAVTVVENNYADIYEAGYYPYAVIENIRPGLYQYDSKPAWYIWNEKEHGYRRQHKQPDFIDNHFVGFAIG